MATPLYPAKGAEQPAVLAQETNLEPIHNSLIDPQVKPSKRRRKFNMAFKKRILEAFDSYPTPEERSSFLRREGLYYSAICAWRRQLGNGLSMTSKKQNARRVDHITQENEQLKKKLAQAEAIIELQKKVSELFGQHMLPLQLSEVN
jgi:hypothetical protein